MISSQQAEPGLRAEPLITLRGTTQQPFSTSPRCGARWLCLLVVGALLLSGLQGCSDLARSSLQAARETVRRHPQVKPTTADVAAKPYFQMQATSREGSAVLILGNVDGAREAWYGARDVVIFLDKGRIVQTTGLSQNLQQLQLAAGNPFAHGLQRVSTPADYQLTMDWAPGYRYGVQVHAHLVKAGNETIEILGTPHAVVRFDEQLSAPAAGFRATNHYWVDPADGFVWKSQQSVAPGITLSLLQLKPYRGKQP